MSVTPPQLVKALHPFLTETVSQRDLKNWGWYDYLSLDVHASNDPAEVACAALLYLVVDDGRWIGRESVIVAVINFANDRTGRQVDASQMQRLAAIFNADPLDEKSVQEWFDLVYR